MNSKLQLPPQLGLHKNWHQFTLLVIVNAFVGAMIGLERSLLPEIAEKEFGLSIKTSILSFIIVFGFTKAFTNYFAGRWSYLWGRKKILLIGWLLAIPVPLILIWAPNWTWILVANLFLGFSQGLTWSTTVIMKIDLSGPQNRGLAMGLNEFAGYFALALSALAAGTLATRYGLRPVPFYLGIGYVAFGLLISLLMARETSAHVVQEIAQNQQLEKNPTRPCSQPSVMWPYPVGAPFQLASVVFGGIRATRSEQFFQASPLIFLELQLPLVWLPLSHFCRESWFLGV